MVQSAGPTTALTAAERNISGPSSITMIYSQKAKATGYF